MAETSLPPGAFHGLVHASMTPLLPRVGELPGVEETGLDGFLRRVHADAPPAVWWGLVGAALAYQVGPLLTLGLPWPAAWLGVRRADDHADRAARTPVYVLRQATFLLLTFAGLCWGADPDVRRSLSQDPIGPDPDAWRTS